MTWARRQRTRIQARNGLNRVLRRTRRKVSRVRWLVQGFEGAGGGRVLFVVILRGVDIFARSFGHGRVWVDVVVVMLTDVTVLFLERM